MSRRRGVIKLKDRLDRERQLPVEEAVRIATNVAEALDYGRAAGVACP